jgi:hypothetical protein
MLLRGNESRETRKALPKEAASGKGLRILRELPSSSVSMLPKRRLFDGLDGLPKDCSTAGFLYVFYDILDTVLVLCMRTL